MFVEEVVWVVELTPKGDMDIQPAFNISIFVLKPDTGSNPGVGETVPNRTVVFNCALVVQFNTCGPISLEVS